MDLELLPQEFIGKAEVKGVRFKQLYTFNNSYLYERTSEDTDKKYYEVFLKKQINKFDFETNTVLDTKKEIYPKSKDFGIWAWCLLNEETALKKCNELENLTQS